MVLLFDGYFKDLSAEYYMWLCMDRMLFWRPLFGSITYLYGLFMSSPNIVIHRHSIFIITVYLDGMFYLPNLWVLIFLNYLLGERSVLIIHRETLYLQLYGFRTTVTFSEFSKEFSMNRKYFTFFRWHRMIIERL